MSAAGPMSPGQFLVELVVRLPEVAGVVAEHLDDQFGTLLLHLLVADIRRFTLDAWQRGEPLLTERCLNFMDSALRTGSPEVQNAVAVSFVEDIGWWEEGVQPFLRVWPAALAAEVARQRSHAGLRAPSEAGRLP